MNRWERWLVILLRVTGVVIGVALAAAVMPRSWMAAAHAWMGLGKLPPGLLVEYLARGLSSFYALLGGLLWVVSFDVRKYRALLWYIALAWTAMAILELVTLWPWQGTGFYWMIVVDAGSAIMFNIVVLVLLAKLPARS